MKTFNYTREAIDYSVSNPSEVVEFKSYYDGGQHWKHCFYVNGLVHGEYKSYWYNGNLDIHFFYVNGKPHGESKSYWGNGQLRKHCFLVSGLLHGEFKLYYDDGSLCEHLFYVTGEEINVGHLLDGSYKSLCTIITLFDGNVIDEDI